MSFPIDALLNLFNASIIIGAAVGIIYMALKIRNIEAESKLKVGSLKILTLLLGLFLLVHGFYHFLEFYSSSYSSNLAGLLSDSIVEPSSWAFLAVFSVYFAKHA